MQKTREVENQELNKFKALSEFYEKRCRKLDVLNDNLYGWVFGLGTALFVSVVLNLIQLAN